MKNTLSLIAHCLVQGCSDCSRRQEIAIEQHFSRVKSAWQRAAILEGWGDRDHSHPPETTGRFGPGRYAPLGGWGRHAWHGEQRGSVLRSRQSFEARLSDGAGPPLQHVHVSPRPQFAHMVEVWRVWAADESSCGWWRCRFRWVKLRWWERWAVGRRFVFWGPLMTMHLPMSWRVVKIACAGKLNWRKPRNFGTKKARKTRARQVMLRCVSRDSPPPARLKAQLPQCSLARSFLAYGCFQSQAHSWPPDSCRVRNLHKTFVRKTDSMSSNTTWHWLGNKLRWPAGGKRTSRFNAWQQATSKAPMQHDAMLSCRNSQMCAGNWMKKALVFLNKCSFLWM